MYTNTVQWLNNNKLTKISKKGCLWQGKKTEQEFQLKSYSSKINPNYRLNQVHVTIKCKENLWRENWRAQSDLLKTRPPARPKSRFFEPRDWYPIIPMGPTTTVKIRVAFSFFERNYKELSEQRAILFLLTDSVEVWEAIP